MIMFIKNIVIIVMLLLLSSATSARTTCKRHPIYCQIKKNKHKINKKYAMTLSNVIYKATRKYNIPPRIFTAILAQESGYSLKAKGCHRGLIKQKVAINTFIIRYKMVEFKVCADFGIGQIYFKTAKGYGFDIDLLTTNLEYSINAAAKVLADFKKRYERREVNWWLRYNCGVRGSTRRDTCQIYKKMVTRYF